MYDGQSLPNVPDINPFPSLVATALTNKRPFRVANLNGTTYGARATSTAVRVDRLFGSSERGVVIDCGGTSDLIAGTSAATLLSTVQSYAQARQAVGWRVIVCTIPPWTTITGPQETERAAYNTSLRAAGWWDALADLAAHANLDDASDTTYYVDGTHFTAAGAQAARDVVLTALATLGVT